MTNQFDQAVARAVTDSTFSRALSEQPEATLADFTLSEAEREALRSLDPMLIQALQKRERLQASIVQAGPWWQPSTFREMGAAILSLLLIVLLLITAWVTFAQIDAAPIVVQVGEEAVQVVDPYERAQGLLNIFFPLFGAVVTFWLGVTIEGRRADRNEVEAAQAKVEQAMESIRREEAVDVMYETEAHLEQILAEQEEAGGFEESLGTLSGESQPGTTMDTSEVKAVLAKLRENRRKLRR